MPISRLWTANLLAVAGLVLAMAAGGSILSGSAPVQAIDRGGADDGLVSDPVEAPWIPEQPGVSAAPHTSEKPTIGAASSAIPPGFVAEPALPSSPIPPSPVVHLWIPAIAVDAQVLPVDSVPTGARNAWGGEVFAPIDFPVDRYVRQ